MSELSPPDCDSPTVVEAHEDLYELFLVDGAPFAARNGLMEIYHRFYDWDESNGAISGQIHVHRIFFLTRGGG